VPTEALDWLLAGDPAIVWQVQRDLQDRAPRTWRATMRQVASRGWGAQLLAHRAADGCWGGGWYNPKWTSTFYTMQLLVCLGLPPRSGPAVATGSLLLQHGVREDGSVVLWQTPRPDTCVAGMLLHTVSAVGLADDPACDAMTQWLLGEQLPDGGWNCNRHRGATHSSFHTTLSVLEGLWRWSADRSEAPTLGSEVLAASERGREFLLAHHLYRSHTTGRVARSGFTRFSFPHWWYYDVMRALDHFRDVGAAWDERLADPVNLLVEKRRPDGRWNLQSRHPGRTWFEMENPGQPSRWNTLRAMRILRWAADRGGS
jgi:hypothetical protein